jgi:hypothetical protein
MLWGSEGSPLYADGVFGQRTPTATHETFLPLDIRTTYYGSEQLGHDADSSRSYHCIAPHGINDHLPPPIGTAGHSIVTTGATGIKPSKGSFVQSQGARGITCQETGCSYKGTFRGPWELKRHTADKHSRTTMLSCPVTGCIKGSQASTFVRFDKLTDHIRAAHYSKGARAVCPAPDCAKVPLEIKLLGMHVRLYHPDKRQGGVVAKTLRAIANAASADHHQCPLQSCKKRIVLEDFTSHLLWHTSEDLDAATHLLTQEGYRVGKFRCEHSEEGIGSVDGWCICGMNSIEITCPICASCHWDKQSLSTHIKESHLDVGEDMIPFRQRILALIGTEAIQMLGNDVWRDVACRLTFDADE